MRATGLQRPVGVQLRIGSNWVDRGPPITDIGAPTSFHARMAPGLSGFVRSAPTGGDRLGHVNVRPVLGEGAPGPSKC